MNGYCHVCHTFGLVLETNRDYVCQHCGSTQVLTEEDIREMMKTLTNELEPSTFPADEMPVKPKFLN